MLPTGKEYCCAIGLANKKNTLKFKHPIKNRNRINQSTNPKNNFKAFL
jgi:hypothetical protein